MNTNKLVFLIVLMSFVTAGSLMVVSNSTIEVNDKLVEAEPVNLQLDLDADGSPDIVASRLRAAVRFARAAYNYVKPAVQEVYNYAEINTIVTAVSILIQEGEDVGTLAMAKYKEYKMYEVDANI